MDDPIRIYRDEIKIKFILPNASSKERLYKTEGT